MGIPIEENVGYSASLMGTLRRAGRPLNWVELTEAAGVPDHSFAYAACAAALTRLLAEGVVVCDGRRGGVVSYVVASH